MNVNFALPRTSCVIVHEASLSDHIIDLNKRGWYVTSGRRMEDMTQIALQVIFLEGKNNGKCQKLDAEFF